MLYGTSGQCSNLSTAQCTFDRGGAFDSSLSSTFSAPPDPSAAEFRAADHGSLSITALGADIVALNSTVKIPSFPLFAPTTGALPQSGLGLGRNSTFLEYLYKSKQIASRSWSLFWALEGGSPSTQMDGSLTLGGFDESKTTGANLTQSFSSLEDMTVCPSSMIVFIADVIVQFPNGTSNSLFGSAEGSAMRSCIKPDIPLITFPSAVWQAFSAAIGGTYIAPSESYKLWGMDYAANGVFDGDLSFLFSSGLEITIPNSQLVVPDVQVNQAGQMDIPNSNNREILIYNLETSNVNDMPLLGQAFLTSAYIHVNNDDEEFTIWQANPTKGENLVTVGSQSTCHQTTSNQTTFGGTGPVPKNSVRTLSAAVISAISIGIILAIGTIIIALYFLRRKQRRQSDATCSDSTEKRRSLPYDTYKEMTSEIDGASSSPPRQLRHEMPTYGHNPAQELVGWEAPVYEMPAARWSGNIQGAQSGQAAVPKNSPMTLANR
jgi:hypothetical protein